MDSSVGLMADATKDSGRTANKMARGYTGTKKEYRSQGYGIMVRKSNGWNENYISTIIIIKNIYIITDSGSCP